MRTFEHLIYLIKEIQRCSAQHQEKWETFSASGGMSKELLPILIESLRIATTISAEVMAVDVDGTQCDEFELSEFTDFPVGYWRIVLRKDTLAQLCTDAGRATFFLDESSFSYEVGNIDPLKPPTIFSGEPLTIFVVDLPVSFGGPLINVCAVGSEVAKDFVSLDLPSEDIIRTQVHVATSDKIILDPQRFLLTWGDMDSECARRFNLLAAIILSAALCQDFFGENRIVVKGLRRVELPLYNSSDIPPSVNSFRLLIEAVQWVFSERVETRAKLISDRLSLEIEKGNSFYAEVIAHIGDAFRQSVEQYGFVILDRKDAYVKELKELLKEVRSQADIYVQKLRGLLNNLLRDVLAAFILISINIVTRISSNSKAIESDETAFLFKALAIYLIISLVLQIVIDMTDILQSRSEYERWTSSTRNYLAAAERDKYFVKPLSKRFTAFLVQLMFISLIYILLSVGAWNFQGMILSQKSAKVPGDLKQETTVPSINKDVPKASH